MSGQNKNLLINAQLKVDQIRATAKQLEQDLKKAANPSTSPAFQQLAKDLATAKVNLAEAVKEQKALNTAVEQEVRARNQAAQAAQKQAEAAKQSRQQAFQQAGNTLQNAIPGGNLIGGGLGGTVALAGAAAAAAGIATVEREFQQLVSRANELSQSADKTAGKLGELRTAIEKTGVTKDIAATSPGILDFAKLAEDIKQNITKIIYNMSGTPEERSKALDSKLKAGLGGEDKETWRRMGEQRADMETDLAMRGKQLANDQAKATRDYQLEVYSFRIQKENELASLQLQHSQAVQQQQLSMAKIIADTSFKASQEKFQLDRKNAAIQFATDQANAQAKFALDEKYAQANFNRDRAIKQEDFALSKKNKQEDFALSQKYAAQDFALSQRYKQQDFANDQSDKARKFGIGVGRDKEDYLNNLQDMSLSGNASAVDYFRLNREFQKSQRRNLEDYNLDKGISGRDFLIGRDRDSNQYGIDRGREANQYGIDRGREKNQFALDQNRDTEGYNLDRQKNQEGFDLDQSQKAFSFALQQAAALAQNQIDVQAHAIEQQFAMTEALMQASQETDRFALAMKTFNDNAGIGAQQLKNKGTDLAFQQQMDKDRFNLDAFRQRRDTQNQFNDFAGSMRKKDPLGAAGFGSQDYEFGKALQGNAQQTGQEDLFKVVNAAIADANKGPGAAIGGILGKIVGAVSEFFDFAQNPSGHMTKRDEELEKKFEQGKKDYAKQHPNEAALAGYDPNTGAIGATTQGQQIQVTIPVTVQGGGLNPDLEKALKDIQNFVQKSLGEAANANNRNMEEKLKQFAAWQRN